MARLFKIVEDHKASKWLRFSNYIIDLVAFYLILLVVAALTGFFIGYFYTVNDVEVLAQKFENLNDFLVRIMALILYGLFMFSVEYISKGRSLGKIITGTMVVKTDASDLSFQDYFVRNISRAIPFDQLSFFGKNGWHDTIFDTRVVNKKNFEESRRLKQDLDNLGNNSENNFIQND